MNIKNIGNIMTSTALSGGIVNSGTLSGYINDTARRALGMSLGQLTDGQVRYFSRDTGNVWARAIKQAASQEIYGQLRSYPRYMRYLENMERKRILETESETSTVNRGSMYHRLVEDSVATAKAKGYTDSIVGTQIVADYLELAISGSDPVTFVDLQPQVKVSTKKNVLLTTVQGRDYTRKEFISGGDFMVSISGKITSKYPDVYPEAEVSKFLKIMELKGVIDCDNTILRQFKISQLIVLDYSVDPVEGCRNVQPYTIQCVSVEPSEAIEVILAAQEVASQSVKQATGWEKLVKDTVNTGIKNIDPSSLLQLTKQWL